MASHLVAAARALGADDPERAYEHAKVARRFAGRIGIVREATGIAAYHAGQYAEALGDLRAARRMTGSDAYLPIMADCERGLGRPERALDLVRSREAERLDRAGKIELAIVESGARRDLGQHDAAVITLQRVPELREPQPKPWSARLAFAYADALADAGHESAATDWFARAVAFDEDGETDAAERYAELTGAVIEDLEEDEVDLGDDEPEKSDELFEELDDLDEDQQVETDEPETDLGDVGPVGEQDEQDEQDELGEREDATDKDGDIAVVILETGPDDDSSDDTVGIESKGESKGDGTAGAEAKGEVTALGPAFIEPNFGDVLDDPEDREKPEA